MTHTTKPDRRYLRTSDAAHYLQMGASTLEKLRMTGDGPPFARVTGRAVVYRVEDLDAWMASRLCRSTADHLDRSKQEVK